MSGSARTERRRGDHPLQCQALSETNLASQVWPSRDSNPELSPPRDACARSANVRLNNCYALLRMPRSAETAGSSREQQLLQWRTLGVPGHPGRVASQLLSRDLPAVLCYLCPPADSKFRRCNALFRVQTVPSANRSRQGPVPPSDETPWCTC